MSLEPSGQRLRSTVLHPSHGCDSHRAKIAPAAAWRSPDSHTGQYRYMYEPEEPTNRHTAQRGSSGGCRLGGPERSSTLCPFAEGQRPNGKLSVCERAGEDDTAAPFPISDNWLGHNGDMERPAATRAAGGLRLNQAYKPKAMPRRAPHKLVQKQVRRALNQDGGPDRLQREQSCAGVLGRLRALRRPELRDLGSPAARGCSLPTEVHNSSLLVRRSAFRQQSFLVTVGPVARIPDREIEPRQTAVRIRRPSRTLNPYIHLEGVSGS
eukprot:COSAG04_NODE_321_length_16881_cov_18.146347_1_plen_267_part_00